MCQAGLNYLHSKFEFVRDGQVLSLENAMAKISSTFPGEATVRGSGAKTSTLTVPYRCDATCLNCWCFICVYLCGVYVCVCVCVCLCVCVCVCVTGDFYEGNKLNHAITTADIA